MADSENTKFVMLNFKQHKHKCAVPSFSPEEIQRYAAAVRYPGRHEHFVKDRDVTEEIDRRKFVRILPGDRFLRWEDSHLVAYTALQPTWGVYSKVARYTLPPGVIDRNGAAGGGYQVQLLRNQCPANVGEDGTAAPTAYFSVNDPGPIHHVENENGMSIRDLSEIWRGNHQLSDIREDDEERHGFTFEFP